MLIKDNRSVKQSQLEGQIPPFPHQGAGLHSTSQLPVHTLCCIGFASLARLSQARRVSRNLKLRELCSISVLPV